MWNPMRRMLAIIGLLDRAECDLARLLPWLRESLEKLM
jgi:hypothetical protein